MQVKHIILLTSICALFFASCEEQASYLPASTGKPGDVLVVADQHVLEGPVKSLIDSILGRDEIGLPRPEPLFKVGSVQSHGFSNTVKIHRNVIQLRLDPTMEGQINVKRNLYAKEQLVFNVSARNIDELYSTLQIGLPDIERKLHLTEMVRLRKRFEQLGPANLTNELRSSLDCSMAFDKGYKLARDSAGVKWYMKDTRSSIGGFSHQVSKGIVVFEQPYSDTLDLEPGNILAMKDSVTQWMVQGTRDSSYMVTSPFKDPVTQVMDWTGHYAVQINGLWRMHNDNMGGPFVHFAVHDAARRRIVHTMGYVFAPQFEKREHLLAVEAVLKSIEFVPL